MKSEIIYLNDERELVEKDDATACEIIEYDDDGNVVTRTYGTIGDSQAVTEDEA